MNKVYIGIDLSMTSPGISCLNEDGTIKWMRFFAQKPKYEGNVTDTLFGITYPSYECDEERFFKISMIIIDLIQREIALGFKVKICMEGYSYGSSSSRLFQIAENGGMMKHQMWTRKMDYIIAAPSAIKKHATGKGNANKELVYEAFIDKYGIELHSIFGLKTKKAISPISDIADSVFMASYRLANERL